MVNESLEQEALELDEYTQALQLSQIAPIALADAPAPATVLTTQFYVLQSPAPDTLYSHLFQATPRLLRIEDYTALLQAGLQHALWLLPDFSVATIWLYEQRTGKLALPPIPDLRLMSKRRGYCALAKSIRVSQRRGWPSSAMRSSSRSTTHHLPTNCVRSWWRSTTSAKATSRQAC